MNFINLNDDNGTPSINLKTIQIEQEPVRDIIITPVEVTLPENVEEKEGCIKEECPVTVGCSDEYFAIKNLFSELTDDYQRAIIRLNLGISNGGTLLWGKIEGNLSNQKDLTNFIQDTINGDKLHLLDQVNLELKYWTLHVENKIESLANNIVSFDIIPRYATSTLLPVNVLVTWEYDLPVEAQAINGVVLDPSVRNYIFENVNDAISIRLSYYYKGAWLSRYSNFEVTFPTFYGTSSNYEECDYTTKDKVVVNAEEELYIYIITKKESDLSVNGIIGGFILDSITYILDTRYYVYKSVNSGLGETIVRINDKE